jgi:hypothetical protein
MFTIAHYRSATRYLCPSFSSSAMTQSVTHGIPGGSKRCSNAESRNIIATYTSHKDNPSSQISTPVCSEGWNWWSWYLWALGKGERGQCYVPGTERRHPVYWRSTIIHLSNIPMAQEILHSANSFFLCFRLLLGLLCLILFSVDSSATYGALITTTYNRTSLGLSNRFTAANFLVFFALPLKECLTTQSI